MAKPAHAHPEKLELYRKVVATIPGAEIRGAGVPYTSINGNMSSYLNKDGKLELRLPEAERDEFLKKHKARMCEAYGKVQPEYVETPDALLARTSELKKYFEISYAYVSSLKPKPTTKKKKT